MYGGERADLRALTHLEGMVRELGEELAGWRTRALKAEGEAKGARGGRAARGGADADARATTLELEAENRLLRQRVEAARVRVADLMSRLAFLEEQARIGVGGGA